MIAVNPFRPEDENYHFSAVTLNPPTGVAVVNGTISPLPDSNKDLDPPRGLSVRPEGRTRVEPRAERTSSLLGRLRFFAFPAGWRQCSAAVRGRGQPPPRSTSERTEEDSWRTCQREISGRIGTRRCLKGYRLRRWRRKSAPRFARMPSLARWDGKLVDLSFAIAEDCAVEIVHARERSGAGGLSARRGHLMAQAIKRFYGGDAVQLGIGPVSKTDSTTTSSSPSRSRRPIFARSRRRWRPTAQRRIANRSARGRREEATGTLFAGGDSPSSS